MAPSLTLTLALTPILAQIVIPTPTLPVVHTSCADALSSPARAAASLAFAVGAAGLWALARCLMALLSTSHSRLAVWRRSLSLHSYDFFESRCVCRPDFH